jgi:hypothetical protein
MLRKSPIAGIYIFSAVFLFIGCASAGIVPPSILLFAPLIGASILTAGKQYPLLAISFVAGALLALLTGGWPVLVMLAGVLAIGAFVGFIIQRSRSLTRALGAGAFLFSALLFLSLVFYSYAQTGSFSQESLLMTTKALTGRLEQVYSIFFQMQGIDPSQAADLFKVQQVYWIQNAFGIVGGFGVVISFFSALPALFCVCREAGVKSNITDFKLSRVGAAAALLSVFASYGLSGIPQIVSRNLSAVLLAAFFFGGCTYLIRIIRQGALFRTPFLFYGILLALFLLGVGTTLNFLGIYSAFDIDWSKLKPQDLDDE